MPELLTLQYALRIEPDQPLLKHFSCDQTEEKRTQKLKFSLMFAVYSLMFFVFSRFWLVRKNPQALPTHYVFLQ